MRSSFADHRGVRLVRSPNARQQSARRRWMALAGMAALALVSAAIGLLTAGGVPEGPATGPFSYFPYQ